MRKYSIIKITDKDIEEIYNTLKKAKYSGIESSNLEHLVNGDTCVEPRFLCLNVSEKRYEFVSDSYDLDDDSPNYLVKRYQSWKHFAPILQGRVQI